VRRYRIGAREATAMPLSILAMIFQVGRNDLI